jgi:hypothetical protein
MKNIPTVSTSYKAIRFYTVLFLLCFCGRTSIEGAALYSITNGDWSTPGTWSLVSGGGNCGCTPSSSDDINLSAGYTVTSTVSFTIGSGGTINLVTGSTLDFGSNSLTVGNGGTLSMSGGFLIVQDLTFNNGSTVNVSSSSADIQVKGNFLNKNNSNNITINGYMSVAGTASAGNGSTIAGTGSLQVTGTMSGAGTFFGGSVSCTNCSTSSGGTVLPIVLTSFSAKVLDNEVQLKWTTATETNNNYFKIERISNSGHTELLGEIKGAGNSNEPLQYLMSDISPLNGIAYYRLSQTDFNGKTSTFAPIAVNKEETAKFSMFPNPSQDAGLFFSISKDLADQPILVVFFDMLGNETYSKVIPVGPAGSIQEVIDPSQKLLPGVYLVVASSENATYKQKLIIR